ncbi:hypothetical protein BT93_C0631 [Corymbia citriodora subsp. variegata]|nr:hypothetical protein BT93_C0631 [Corymbia citriodora subsp. variegata]
MVSSLHIYLQLLCIISRCQIKISRGKKEKKRSRLQRKCMYRDVDEFGDRFDRGGSVYSESRGLLCLEQLCCLWGVYCCSSHFIIILLFIFLFLSFS